jgi:hypothetical protein
MMKIQKSRTNKYIGFLIALIGLILLVVSLSGCISEPAIYCTMTGVKWGNSFKHPITIGEECDAIIACQESSKLSPDILQTSHCFTLIAVEYNDSRVCDAITLIESTYENPQIRSAMNMLINDSYWVCKAYSTHNQTYCNEINSTSVRNSCLTGLGGTSILTEEECKKMAVYAEECKTIQIDVCKETDDDLAVTKSNCFLKLADGYKDEMLCNYIRIIAEQELKRYLGGNSDIVYDDYWECKAITTGSKSYCENIDSVVSYESCLSKVG